MTIVKLLSTLLGKKSMVSSAGVSSSLIRYFVIAHEIAHNKAFFHDEDHELLFTSIAQTKLINLMKLLATVAPTTRLS